MVLGGYDSQGKASSQTFLLEVGKEFVRVGGTNQLIL